MSWWVHELWQAGRAVELISWIFWVIFSITLHELAHGWAALWQGDGTPREMGRMTWNPMVHMGQWSIIVFLVIGIAWGMMPVNPSRFRWGRQGRVVVSGAGPAMNVALALASLTLLAVWIGAGPPSSPLYKNLAIFLWTGGWLNLVLAVFNLLPIPPLDGADVLSGLSFRAYVFFNEPRAQMIGMFVFLVVFMSGCFGLIFDVAAQVAGRYVDLLGLPFGSPSVFRIV